MTSSATMIQQGAPHLITSEEQLAAYTAELYVLTDIAQPNTNESDAIALLTLLIETYEREAYPLPKASPVEVLRFLLESNNLQQKDLHELGTASNISLILSGKRNFTMPQILALAKRFRVEPSVFFGGRVHKRKKTVNAPVRQKKQVRSQR